MFKRRNSLAEMKLRAQAKPTGVMVISGFLGAGKTRLIQRLLAGPLVALKVVLIENDFGELNLDAGLLSDQGFTVKALTHGCICCSLTGEFVASVQSVIKTYQPDLILIEPSGVGKLSDIRRALSKVADSHVLFDLGRITVVDSMRCRLYYDNFADFFDDQAAEASSLFLSRTDLVEVTEEAIAEAKSLLCSLNEEAVIYTNPDEICRAVAEATEQLRSGWGTAHYIAGRHVKKIGEASNWQKGTATRPEAEAGVDFRQVTLSFPLLPDPAWPEILFERLSRTKGLRPVRAKGVIQLPFTDDPESFSYYELQYVPGDLRLTPTGLKDNRLTFIGPHLEGDKLVEFVKLSLRQAGLGSKKIQ